jgi:hypothetical protein
LDGSVTAKVPPAVFVEKLLVPSIKQSGVITPELLAPTFKASTDSNMEDDQKLQSECYSTTKNYLEIS